MCSKASYRVKTMDSLDYRDLVCVFSNTKSHCYWSLLIFHKSKENMMFKPPTPLLREESISALKPEWEMYAYRNDF